jgi:hypothetical protein
MLTYVQLADSLTFFTEEYGLKIINKDKHPRLYSIISNNFNDKEALDSALVVHNIEEPADLLRVAAAYQYRGKEVSPSLISLAAELEKEGYPLTPLINFLDKCLEMKDDTRFAIQELVATRQVPITFDGNVIFYRRSNWWTGMPWGKTCVPGEVVTGGQYMLGLLEWSINGCLDQGPLSEVVVQPVHIQSVDAATATRASIHVSSYTYLGVLELDYEIESRIVIVHDKVDTLGNHLLVRLPYNTSSLTTYLAELVRGSLPITEPTSSRIQGVMSSC